MSNCTINGMGLANKTRTFSALGQNHTKINSVIKNAKMHHKKSKIMQIFVIFITICVIFVIIANPNKFIDSARKGVFLWGNNVLPALFPFMCLTKILVGILPKHKIKPSLYVFCLSVLSGYPIASKLLRDYYDKGMITTEYAKRVYSYSATSGPIFVIGTVGVIFFNDIRVGVLIFVVHIVTALLTGILFGGFKKCDSKCLPYCDENINYGEIVSDSVFSSITSILIVGAYIMVFYVLFDAIASVGIFNIITSLLAKLNISSDLSFGVLSGIIELTRGLYQLGAVGGKLAVAMSGGLISFSGLCILMQSYTFLHPVGVKFGYICMVKIIHALLTFIGLALLLLCGI